VDSNLQTFVANCHTLFSQGRWEEVEGLAREAVGRGLTQPPVFAMMGAAYAKRGNPELAQQALEAACGGQGHEVADRVAEWLRSLLHVELAESIRQGMARRFPQEPAFAAAWTSGAGPACGSGAIGAWPYMNEIEVQGILAALRVPAGPFTVLEWGGGHSTYFYARRLPKGSTWHSVEHDRTWFANIESQSRPADGATLNLHLVPNSGPYREGIDDGDMDSFRDYIVFPRRLGARFQFILVDGRARIECLREGWRLLTPDGIMVLHDGERSEYRPGHPEDAFSLEISNPSLKDRKSVLFFVKSLETFRALSRALREVLPIFVTMTPAMPRVH
jgi:hypothetical protein